MNEQEILCGQCGRGYRSELEHPYPLCADCAADNSEAEWKRWAEVILGAECGVAREEGRP